MPGVQAVSAGVGVTIDANGVLSLDGSDPAFNGFIKTNNQFAFNAYVWPGVDGTADQFLQTDGAGNLTWADASGFAVVTVDPNPPTPPTIGELWFDCDTGTLNVYQDCVGTPSPNWFNVAQPGFPVDPTNTTATPPFTNQGTPGAGTQANPYDCTLTITGAGSSVFVVNTVRITGLAPFQFVPIVDLNAIANGGRFSFSNNYADSSGVLEFQTIFKDQPTSTPPTSYTAAIKVGYGSVYIDAIVNVVTPLSVSGGTVTGPAYSNQQLTYTPGVPSGGSTPYGSPTYQWLANGIAISGATGLTYTVAALDVGKVITATTRYTDASGQTATGTSNSIGPIVADPGTLTVLPGSIAPTTGVVVGNVLTYTPGSYSLGIPPITATWVWQRAGVDIAGTTGLTSYTTVTADAGQAITVRYTATDSSTPTADTAFASTNAVTPTAPFPGGVWGPTPANGMDTNPGGISGIYSGTGTTITVTGCLESAVYTPPALPSFDATPKSITSGQTLAIRWAATALCGNANTNTPMNGTVSDGIYTNSYSLNINRVPTAIGDITDTNVALGATVSKGIATAISGLNSVAYVTAGSGSTGTSIGVSLTPGGPFTPIPATGSTSFPISNTQTLYVEQTVGGAINTAPGYTAVVKVGDADGVLADEFTYFAQTVSTAVFPGLTFSPAGGPNAANESVVNVIDGTLGTLNGVANSNGWPTGLGTTLSSPLSGGVATMKFQKNGAGGFVTSGLGVVPTDILNLAWNVPYLDTVATGSPANGSITGTVGGTTYTNTFTMTVKRAAAFTTTSGASSGASGTITLVSQVPDQYNVPVKVYQTAPGGNALTSVTVDINSTGPVSLPTSLATALTLNPGETVVFSATAPGATATYTTDIHIGDTVHTWSYQVTVTPTVSTPSINNPGIGTTVNPTANAPAGITVTTPTTGNAGGFQTNYGGTQTASDWYVYKAIPQAAATSQITGVNSVGGNLSTWSSVASPPAVGSFSYRITSYATNGVRTIATTGLTTNLVRTTDGGATWTSDTVNTFSCVAYLKGKFWGINGGVIKTSLDGVSWTTVVTLPLDAKCFTYDAVNNVWIASGIGTTAPTSVYRSTTDWATYTTVTTSNLPYWVTPQTSGGGILMGIGTIFSSQCYRSTDGGLNWSLAGGSAGPGLPIYAMMYVGSNTWLRGGSTPNFIEKSTNGGTSWSALTVPAAQNGISGGVLINNTVIFTGSTNVSYSTDFTNFTLASVPDALTDGFLAAAAGDSAFSLGSSAGTPKGNKANIGYTQLTFADNSGFTDFSAGLGVIQSNGAAAGSILSLNSAGPTMDVVDSFGPWGPANTGLTVTNPYNIVTPPAPPALPPTVPDNTKYTAVSGFPLNKTSGTFNEAFIPLTDLSASSKYYASTIYTGTTGVVSTAASWSDFLTSSFTIPAGTPMGGGYYGGQIKIGSTIYNLIVAPVEGDNAGPATGGALKGQYGGSTPSLITWKNASTAETGGNITLAQNEAYGKPWTDQAGTTGNYAAGTYPLFQWCKGDATGPNGGGGIGGNTDWYIPARNELAVLYFFLKPGTTANDTTSGSNANSVAPYTPNTNYGAGFPSQTSADGTGGLPNFRTGGTQDFNTVTPYWSANESTINPTLARNQGFSDGGQGSFGSAKNGSSYARAIRRVLA